MIGLCWRGIRGAEDIITWQGAQCEVEHREPGGAQSEVKLQEADRARDRRLGRTRGDVAR